MALDDTSYPHLCTAHLSRPYVPMLCLWVPSHWPWNPSPQTGAGRQAPRHRCPRPPRRGTTQDGAGYRRMAQDGQEHVGVFLLRSASIPWDTMTHDGLFMLFEFHRIPTSSHPEGRESWTPDAAHRSKVEQVNCVAASGAPLRAFGPRDPRGSWSSRQATISPATTVGTATWTSLPSRSTWKRTSRLVWPGFGTALDKVTRCVSMFKTSESQGRGRIIANSMISCDLHNSS